MANIKNYLDEILAARYGRDVRNSIHDALEAVNTEATSSAASAEACMNILNDKMESVNSAIQLAQDGAGQAFEAAERAESYVLGDISEKTVTYTEPAQNDETAPISGTKLSAMVGWVVERIKTLTAVGKKLEGDVSALNGKKGTVPAGSIDGIITEGVYWCDFANTTGAPYTSGYGWLEVIKSADGANCVQRITRFHVSGAQQNAVRFRANGQWYPWGIINLNVSSSN